MRFAGVLMPEEKPEKPKALADLKVFRVMFAAPTDLGGQAYDDLTTKDVGISFNGTRVDLLEGRKDGVFVKFNERYFLVPWTRISALELE